MHHNNINHRLVVSHFQWSEGQPFPSALETANAAMSPVVSPEAVPAVVPPSTSADAAAQPSGVNQEEEEWGRVKDELFGDRALEMKAEEGQVQEEGGAMLIVKQGQLTLPQTQSNRPSPPTKIPYSCHMLQWDSDIRKEAERVVPGQIYELSNALYGTLAAPTLWGKELRRGQEELGFVPVEQSIAVRREVEDKPAQDVQATHVDDIFGVGERTEEAFDMLGERFKIGSRTKVNVGSKAKYIGIDMYRSDAHTFQLTSESYLEGIDVDAIPGKLKKSLSEKDVAPAEEQDVDISLQEVYQEANGVLGWAVCLNWRRALWFSLLSKATTKPTARHLSAVKTAIHGLKTHREPLVLHGLKGRELHLAGCSDAM
uniref:Reverse transcriptase Ty1/copia-type domain-containing protein n=1 Tax=Chromera velia CCMP2878 TaxID=1169474 RepID=A0A0G4ID12_9ALVE|eukprot:Cvel_2318.t1-p1 / transcript=Cvel_2318.t1 / gene=Cvel_2318 / organism=Chromera_velia_CCMP2878 / gene_product=hypothetical protein / transcript_product=hypothetical protein / location=Cvel_scaffold89:114512-116168(-) / protein_length=370 / sequence_SO=supercontig / SO=protein_coding / is_pseudo=false